MDAIFLTLVSCFNMVGLTRTWLKTMRVCWISLLILLHSVHATLNDVHPVKVMKSGGTVVTVIRVKQRFCKYARLFPSSTDTRQWIVWRVLLSLKWPSKHSGWRSIDVFCTDEVWNFHNGTCGALHSSYFHFSKSRSWPAVRRPHAPLARSSQWFQ